VRVEGGVECSLSLKVLAVQGFRKRSSNGFYAAYFMIINVNMNININYKPWNQMAPKQ